MRRVLLIMAAILLGVAGMHAQDYKYEPLPREGVKWVYYYNKYQKTDSDLIIYKPYYLYEVFFKGDTVMNGGRSYKKLYMSFIDAPELKKCGDWPLAWVRESDKRVYAVLNKKHPYSTYEYDADMLEHGPHIYADDYDSTGEMVLYDFSDMRSLYLKDKRAPIHVIRCDSDSDVVIDGYKRITFIGEYNSGLMLSAGYGALSSGGNFFFPCRQMYINKGENFTIGLLYIKNEQGQMVYKTWRYDKYCSSVSSVLPDDGGCIEVRAGEVVAKAGGTAATLRLVAMNGTVVAQKRVEACGSVSLSTEGLISGVYVAVLTSAQGSQNRKVAVR